MPKGDGRIMHRVSSSSLRYVHTCGRNRFVSWMLIDIFRFLFLFVSLVLALCVSRSVLSGLFAFLCFVVSVCSRCAVYLDSQGYNCVHGEYFQMQPDGFTLTEEGT